jgi:hypothetical protein
MNLCKTPTGQMSRHFSNFSNVLICNLIKVLEFNGSYVLLSEMRDFCPARKWGRMSPKKEFSKGHEKGGGHGKGPNKNLLLVLPAISQAIFV